MDSLRYCLFLANLSVQQTRGITSEFAAENTDDSPAKCVKNSKVGILTVKLLQKDLWNVSFDTFISTVLFFSYFFKTSTRKHATIKNL